MFYFKLLRDPPRIIIATHSSETSELQLFELKCIILYKRAYLSPILNPNPNSNQPSQFFENVECYINIMSAYL